jgi:hypothetical protein
MTAASTPSIAHLVLAGAVLGLAGVVAAFYIRVLRARCRAQELALRELRDRESRRDVYCRALGHHLDELCRCTRCLGEQHDYAVLATERGEVGRELVNPRADPGALHLDSNFQPDPDYGRTQTLFRVERTLRCARCGHTTQTVETEAVVDDP